MDADEVVQMHRELMEIKAFVASTKDFPDVSNVVKIGPEVLQCNELAGYSDFSTFTSIKLYSELVSILSFPVISQSILT